MPIYSYQKVSSLSGVLYRYNTGERITNIKRIALNISVMREKNSNYTAYEMEKLQEIDRRSDAIIGY
jgi:hypothetical protein